VEGERLDVGVVVVEVRGGGEVESERRLRERLKVKGG